MNENRRVCLRHALRIIQVMVVGALLRCSFGETADEPVHSKTRLFESFCSSCHSGDAPQGTFNIEKLLETPALDGKLAFEHLITRRMPPADADQPSQQERLQMASLLAKRQETGVSDSGRRISRFELNHSINDLLGTDREIAHTVPDDRGTCRYDTDQRVRLTPQQLSAYFSLAEQLLDVAFPETGFLPEYVWSTNRLKDSHHTYNIYTTPYKKGMLFSWTRANNGNSYSFFYDDFSPPVAGWYAITFDAAKVGDFKGDVTIQVHAGKYYFADDRPHPQRLLDVISVGDQKVKSYTVRGFFTPGESLSVHCFSQHTWRKENPSEGVYIENVKVRGPLHQWPPESLTNIFPATKLQVPKRHCHEIVTGKSTLERIGGSLSVSSFEQGRGKERLLDGSNRTDWQSRTSGKPAEPPHFITIENPQRAVIEGVIYSTLSGGEASRQVKSYAIYVSSDGVDWGEPIAEGDLLTRLAAEQKIIFSHPTSASWIKFLMTESLSGGESNGVSVAKLDVIAKVLLPSERVRISASSFTGEALEQIIRDFAARACTGKPDEQAVARFVALAEDAYAKTGNLVSSMKLAFKAILCSGQFLLPEFDESEQSQRIASALARTLWLSVPDSELLRLAKEDEPSELEIRRQIDRMIADDKSQRMIHSFCDQWLQLRSFDQVSPSLKLYPAYDDLLNYYLPLETEMVMMHMMRNNLPVTNLIDADFTFINQRLAQHYEIDGVVGQKMRKVSLPPESPRGGLLTMGSVLKVTTDGEQSSPIRRGAWVSQRIVGNTLAPPPENVGSIDSDPGESTNIRAQVALHQENESCAACHKEIDPYGFALESFDATGQFRTRYKESRPHGGTFGYARAGHFTLADDVDASGEIEGYDFADVKGLKKILLASSDKIAYNFMKEFFEYANGREPTLPERLALFRRIEGGTKGQGIKDLVKEVLVFSLTEKNDD